MVRKFSWLPVAGVAALAFVTACGGGGGGGNGSEAGGDDTGTPTTNSPVPVVEETVSSVPIVGEFVADCTDTVVGLIEGFVPAGLPIAPGSLPVLGDAVGSGVDLGSLPVIGGLVPGGDPTDLLPVGPEAVTALLPFDLSSLPILGAAPVTCSSVPSLLPGSVGDLDPTSIIGIIPVLGENGDVIGGLLALVPTTPGAGLPDLSEVALPAGEVLPAPVGSTVGTLLGLLGGLVPGGLLPGGLL